MKKRSKFSFRLLVESLESRRLLVSTGQLLAYDFNGATAWPNAAPVSSAGVTATAAQAAVGTIDVEGSTTQTGGVSFAVTAVPASGVWTSELSSGALALTNTETNLAKLTIGFNLSASQVRVVKLHVYSYNAAGQVTGGLESDVVPASVNSFLRYSVDLSTMKPYGAGTFNPAGSFVSFNFSVSNAQGWSGTAGPQLRVDNLQYSKPAIYVSSIDGNNNDNGRTEATAYATLQKALDNTEPGDIILVKGDTAHPYTVSANNRNYVREGGTPAAWVTMKNYPGQSPLIYTEGWAAIQIGASSASTAPAIAYVELRGLHVKGSSALVGSRSAPDGNVDRSAPNADQYGPYAKYLQPVDPATGLAGLSEAGAGVDSRTNGNGLSISGGNEANKPHDIRFADNLVEQCAGGGMGAGSADRVQFENNISRDNCYWDKYATSGFSVLSTYQFEGNGPNTANTVLRLFRNNISSGNIHKQVWVRNSPTLTQYSDGNGIIIDYNHIDDDVVLGRTLVTNNLVYDNGGSGIHAYNADHVDIINNTAYLNSSSPYLNYGEIFSQSNDTRIYNNILVARVNDTAAGEKPQPVNGGTRPSATNGIVYRNNVYFGGNSNALRTGTTNSAAWLADAYNVGNVIADPKFVAPSLNSALANFRLQSTSPAINLGVTTLAPTLDQANNVRYANPDSGAYEYIPPAPTLIALAPASDTGTTGDNKTRLDNSSSTKKLSFVVSGTVSGAVVQLYANDILVGSATAAGTSTTITSNGTTALANGTSLITAIQTFASAPSALSSSLGVTIDAKPPTLVGTAVNANLASALVTSRSQVRTVSWTFSEPVLAGLADFTLTNTTTGQPVSLASRSVAVSGNVVTLTLDRAGDTYPGLFLANGNYTLSLSPTVTDVAGNALDANGDGVAGETPSVNFYKLLGDVNGDRAVNFNDFLVLQTAFGTTTGSASYNAACDLTGDNQVNFDDFLVLQTAFGATVPAVIPRVQSARRN